MKERPIIFSPPMVKAILEGNKTQTRRGLRPQPHEKFSDIVHYDRATGCVMWASMRGDHGVACPYGVPGDRLWVRETYTMAQRIMSLANTPCYRADEGVTENNTMPDGKFPWKWTPAIHMRREHSRLTLEVTGVRVEPVQDITPKDCEAEGICTRASDGADLWRDDLHLPGWTHDPASLYRKLWNSLNAKRGFGWDKNPWVWVLEFKRI